MLVRVQSKDGTKRIESSSSETMITFFKKIEAAFGVDGKKCRMFLDRNKKSEIKRSQKRIGSFGIKHGDMVYLEVDQGDAVDPPISKNSRPSSNDAASMVKEDAIDIEMWAQDGRIRRNDTSKTMFKIEDLSIEPWDEGYLKEKEIKFLSFHAFMRQQTAGVDKGKYFKLENFKAGCKLNPDGTKRSMVDLPSAVTLNRQKFRHIDNIMFENREIVDRFLNYWRVSGHQRMGFLYGRYSRHSEVPLGIRAEVCAIYEPPQDSTKNSLQFHPDPNDEVVDHIAESLGLRKVGWILTDLLAEENNQGGIVKNTRNPDTYFLSAEECITAAAFQNKHPNPCRLASGGYYGSKFTTVVVSGDKDAQISFEGYQVSNQCMSLVADDCLLPTLDAPELGYIRESSTEIFVSDVYYKEKDEYGNEITKPARPLPLEYLLTDVPAAFSRAPQYTCSNKKAEFPIFNRQQVGHLQTLEALSSYMKSFGPDELVDALSDFHVLLYLATNDTIPFKNEMGMLLDAVRNHNNEMATHWSESASWSTMLELMKHTGGSSHASAHNMDDDMREAIQRSLQML